LPVSHQPDGALQEIVIEVPECLCGD